MPSLASSFQHRMEGFTYYNGALLSSSNDVWHLGIRNRSSVNTPGFGRFSRLSKKKNSSTSLPCNPFGFHTYWIKRGSGEASNRHPTLPNTTYTYSGNLSGVFNYTNEAYGLVCPSPTNDQILELQQRVISRILDKLKGQSVNLAVTFAERKRTADMIGNTAITLAGVITSIKRGDLVGAAARLGLKPSRRSLRSFENQRNSGRQSEAVAKAWLSLQYGWKPLIQDLYGSAEWLANKNAREIKSKVSSRISITLDEERSFRYSSDYPFDIHETKKYNHDESMTIWFSTTGAALASVKEAGFTNPAVVAWELLPYSFVVDWFLPIGNYLSSLDATLGLTFNKGCRTSFRSSSIDYRATAFGAKSPSTGRIHDAIWRSSRHEIICNRVPLNAFPSLSLPSFKNPFSFTRAANAIALLVTAFRR